MGRADASVTTGTAYEALVLLYRHTQARHGLTALAEAWSGTAIPAELQPAADRFFGGDIALGMNVIPFAQAHGLHSLAELIAGLGRTPPVVLAQAMLRSPDATPAEHGRREDEVARVLAGRARPRRLLGELAGERFDTAAAESLLADPAGAAAGFTALLDGYRQVISGHDLLAPQLAAAGTAQALLDALPLDDVARQLFPPWRFAELDAFAKVVLIPSPAIAPFLSARLTSGDTALLVYPVQPHDQTPLADLAAALKALAHPQRLTILRMITLAPITGHALAGALGLTEATVHHHTSLLRAAGLVTSTREAHRVYFTAAPDALDDLFAAIHRTVHGAGASVPQLAR
ncbi:metalloregulator ArsR/SmtB family transcription factor [Nonomuraea sp. NPDC050643]|uniref:ArsR/SmtB family transcription factor n=1 Tax=Nonomuraea sp. NPDC050643 TaxID=3155660 RepID=UPI0033E40D05